MGIGELFEFEKTGRIDPEGKCYHPKTHYEPWPDGSTIEVCDVCGMSRCHYEWDDSGWVMIKDIPKARKELQESIDRITSHSSGRQKDGAA